MCTPLRVFVTFHWAHQGTDRGGCLSKQMSCPSLGMERRRLRTSRFQLAMELGANGWLDDRLPGNDLAPCPDAGGSIAQPSFSRFTKCHSLAPNIPTFPHTPAPVAPILPPFSLVFVFLHSPSFCPTFRGNLTRELMSHLAGRVWSLTQHKSSTGSIDSDCLPQP